MPENDNTSCDRVKLSPVSCWEPVHGEEVLGATLLALGCAHARLGPGEQWLWQRQLGCCMARSWWDHTPRFPSANLTIESSPLCQYLPSVRDRVAKKVVSASISIHPGWQWRGGLMGWLSPPNPYPRSQPWPAEWPLCPVCSSEESWDPSMPLRCTSAHLRWMLLSWALLPMPPCPGH